MEDTQLTLRDILGPLTDFFTKLLSKDGPQWLQAFKRFLRKENPWESALLNFIYTVQVAATGKFIASDHFTTNNKVVKIAWLGDSFQQRFLAKVEKPQAEAILRCHKPKKNYLDAPILAELGDKAETTLAKIWELLKKQPNGESGTLLTNGYANISYVRDANGVLRALDVRWYNGGWLVRDSSVENSSEWIVGYQVFSRNY